MTSSKSTKRALMTGALAILMCVAMLIGTTFAWFTDTASTAVNKIQAGNLDVELAYKNSTTGGEFKKADKSTPVFDSNALWEPGHVEYVVLKVSNAGSLALKYKLGINIASETGSTNVLGNEFKLSDHIRFAVLDGDRTGNSVDRDALVAAATADSKLIKEGYTAENHLTATGTDNSQKVVTLVVWMPTTVGSEANHKTEVTAPSIDLGISVAATQDTVEKDSFDNTYDKDAKYTEIIPGGKTFTGKETLGVGITSTKPNAIAVKAVGNKADVTILDGTFDGGSGGNNQCVHAMDGAKVTIKGGTFTVGGDANGYGNSVIESNGGNIVIEGGFFKTDYQYGGHYYVLNQNNGLPGTITVKGGTFVNYDPSTGDDNLGGNFVAPGYTVITEVKANGEKWYTVVSKNNSEGLKNVLANGGELTVSDEIKTNGGDTQADRVVISKPTTLNLNKKIISPDNMGNNSTNFTALIVDADTTVNAGPEGGIDTGSNGGYGINVREGANLTINGGSYYGGGTAVQVQKGTLTINGGFFAVEPFGEPYGYNFMLNCIDSAYKNGTAKIIVKGGTFVNFNPSNNSAEGAGTSFVAPGYTVTYQTQTNGDIWYTVVAE
jgi:predicted ribosomally synthesized peptide with SipW-like signal peptide